LKGRLLFKKYELEYQKWWTDGISAAKSLFKDGDNVTILNFDFKSYYHSISLDLAELTETVAAHFPDVKNDSLHSIFLSIHKAYHQKLHDIGYQTISLNKNKVSLPIGLLSSGILANWYLKDFDELIIKYVPNSYYGRYVDDLMIVIKDSLIKEFNQNEVDSIVSTTGKFSNEQHYIIHHYVSTALSKVFKLKGINSAEEPIYNVNHPLYENLTLQPSKFFIYQFNVDFSPQLLDKFVEEQQKKSSVFQFLSEDDDSIYKELDKISFDGSLDNQGFDNSGLKHIEENKFKLSIYLSKLARGSMVSGSEYDKIEAEKISKYFKGFYLLRNYFFWEKLLCIWLLRSEESKFFGLIEEIKNQIDRLEIAVSEPEIWQTNTQLLSEKIKDGLRNYLDVAIKMCVGLYPDILKSNQLGFINQLTDEDCIDLYRKTFLLRKNFISYPLLQFTKMGSLGAQSLFKKELVDEAINADVRDLSIIASFFPYRVKFYECCLFTFFCHLSWTKNVTTNEDRTYHSFFNNQKLLEEAFDLFCKMNGVRDDEKEEVRKEYFIYSDLNLSLGKVSFPIEIEINPIKIPNSISSQPGTLRVCLVNKFVDLRESILSMQGSPNSDNKRFEDFNKIFDDIKKVKDPDIVIMPEVCLPYHFIPQAVNFSTFNQTGLISGIEHWTLQHLTFNFVFTILPLKVFDDKDAIILVRLKNHYAPEEEKLVRKNNFNVPKPKPYQYDLVLWRGNYFTTYYCFELADLRHRNLFFGLVDVVFAPVWNMDVYYYNSLVESASRDMHCFIVLANTTQFGDSRITRPSNHDRRDKLRIKGGTVKDHKAIVVVSDLEIGKLRDFQCMEAVSLNPNLPDIKSPFKPLPPDFPLIAAKLRRELQLFDVDEDLGSFLARFGINTDY
jgi:hypothetical protein